jgi:hypothetical protein
MARIFLSCVQQPATRLIDLGRAQHVQSFVRALVVEDFDEVVEAGLLLKKVAGGLRCMRSWRRFEVESPVELLARRIDVLYENLLFQNLIPAFDEVPMRRVFLFVSIHKKVGPTRSFGKRFRRSSGQRVWSSYGNTLLSRVPDFIGLRSKKVIAKHAVSLKMRIGSW